MSQPATDLSCPKCTSSMRSYERNGVVIDQCTACKGVFLDRGELDRLIDAEGSFYGGGRPDDRGAPPKAQYQERPRDEGYGYGGGQHGGKRRKSFLSELFD